jgi:7,8-dihydropterin-6-yl-methyl-4-(beta-D-ribofuranosyl)aminobenzene 5'-phosphate synthase
MSLTRRDLLTYAGATATLASLRIAAEQPAVIPAVDSLDVLFLIDGSVNTFADPVQREDLIVERAGRGGYSDYRRTLAAEFGLSLVLRSQRSGERRTVLLDAGYTPDAFTNNADLLGFDIAGIDAITISHGHYDHFGGLSAILANRRLRRGIPLRTGGEEAFCQRVRTTAAARLPFGALERAAIQSAGLVIEVEPLPKLIADHGLTTGRIPFVTSERPVTPTRMLPGQGCSRAALEESKRSLDEVQDDAIHELGVAYHVRERGLVVIGSCSHRGILNTIRQAQSASGINRLHAVIGGFHLVAPQTAEQARDTARQMAELAPDYVVPGHCSGEPFIAAAESVMPGKVIRPYVGSRFVFGVRPK